MKKWKLIFSQTLMISTGILFGVGVQAAINHLNTSAENLQWQWYIPLSIIFTGFLCALASLFLLEDEGRSVSQSRIRIVLHFIFLFLVVAGCGYLFDWYDDVGGLAVIGGMYVLIYGFVWVGSLWMGKADEKKINEAINEIRDEE
jgi:threonine/homoserine efflux transporter RhtA